MPPQVGYYDALKSSAGKVLSFLSSITFAGTDGKTVTVTQDVSLDEAVALSSKAPKTGVIAGDGMADRVLRRIYIIIQDGTVAANLKPAYGNRWNGETGGSQDNLAKGATAGVWALSADGADLTLLNAGITGTIVDVVAAEIFRNASGAAIRVSGEVNAGILLHFTDELTGATSDLTTRVDTGNIYLNVAYITG